LVSFSPGTLSSADYTIPKDNNYRSSEIIYTSIVNHEARQASGLNGFILLLHIGTSPLRTDKFYKRLPQLVKWLRKRGYEPVRIDQLLEPAP
jgi:peptidoglycan/xylan/chitin deacetylase (PgdA/CDA1 family)